MPSAIADGLEFLPFSYDIEPWSSSSTPQRAPSTRTGTGSILSRKKISTDEFDRKFDDGEDISEYVDWSTAPQPNLEPVSVAVVVKRACCGSTNGPRSSDCRAMRFWKSGFVKSWTTPRHRSPNTHLHDPFPHAMHLLMKTSGISIAKTAERSFSSRAAFSFAPLSLLLLDLTRGCRVQ